MQESLQVSYLICQGAALMTISVSVNSLSISIRNFILSPFCIYYTKGQKTLQGQKSKWSLLTRKWLRGQAHLLCFLQNKEKNAQEEATGVAN